MLTVYKYPVPALDEFTIDMPEGAKLLSYRGQHGSGCGTLFALVEPSRPKVERHFRLADSYESIHDDRALIYVGTAHFDITDSELHLFELGDIPKEGI